MKPERSETTWNRRRKGEGRGLMGHSQDERQYRHPRIFHQRSAKPAMHYGCIYTDHVWKGVLESDQSAGPL